MDRALRKAHLLNGWILCLGILLSACASDGMPEEPAPDEGLEGGADAAENDEAEADKVNWGMFSLSVSIPERVPEQTLHFLLASARTHMNAVRELIRGLKSRETIVFALHMGPRVAVEGGFIAQERAVVSFSLAAEAFLGGGGQGTVRESLLPTSFVFEKNTLAEQAPFDVLSTEEFTFGVDRHLFEQELRALSTVTFASFGSTLLNMFLGRKGLLALSDDHDFNLEDNVSAYRTLARIFYTLVVGPCSDAAQATMISNPMNWEPGRVRALGTIAWSFVKAFSDLNYWARKKHLIGTAAPLILTSSMVATLAAHFELPPELFQEILAFLCGA